jgi:hypothetical protein
MINGTDKKDKDENPGTSASKSIHRVLEDRLTKFEKK